MKILVLSSLYPPDYLGGYELACEDVMNRLRDRGHEAHILTARRRAVAPSLPPDDQWTHRVLDFVPLSQSQAQSIRGRAWREWTNNEACRYWVHSIQPDVVSVWDGWGLLPSLLTTLERTGRPMTYAVSSPWLIEYATTSHRWPAFWDADGSPGLRRTVKRALGSVLRNWIDRAMPIRAPNPDLRYAFFVSSALRDEYGRAGYDCEGAPIIHHGVDTGRFRTGGDRSWEPGVRLLVCGRVVPEKGFHTAIEALALMSSGDWGQDLTLDIVGPQPDPGYVSRLRRAIVQHELEDRVRFHRQVARERMPDIYNSHDVLIVPSTWEEPLALTMLEAMACGLPVVGTATGGSGELLEDGVTGLVFTAGDAGTLAAQLKRIQTVPGLARTLALSARKRVQRDFTIDKTVCLIESFLIDICTKKMPATN